MSCSIKQLLETFIQRMDPFKCPVHGLSAYFLLKLILPLFSFHSAAFCSLQVLPQSCNLLAFDNDWLFYFLLIFLFLFINCNMFIEGRDIFIQLKGFMVELLFPLLNMLNQLNILLVKLTVTLSQPLLFLHEFVLKLDPFISLWNMMQILEKRRSLWL